MPKIADRINGAVVVPGFITTGIVVKIDDKTCDVNLDHLDDSELIEICHRGNVFNIRWNSRKKIGSFVYIAKAWRGWNRKRHFRVQCHKVFADGVIWWREILYETGNGKVVKFVKNHDAIRTVVNDD